MISMLLSGLAQPLFSYAESNIQTGTGALRATANLYFMIKIPPTISVRIGPDQLSKFDLTANNATTSLVSINPLSARILGNSGTILFASSDSKTLDMAESTNIKLTKNVENKISNNIKTAVTYTASMP